MRVPFNNLRKYARYGRRLVSGYFQGFIYIDASHNLHLLSLADSLGRILKTRSGISHFRTAYVGSCGLVMANSEALVDCGFVADGFFEGGQDDRYHPFRPLKELNPNQFDVILLADDDEARETSLDRVLTTRDDLAASNCRIILLRRLFSAHYRALNRLKVGRAFSCLNIRKLCIVASCVYVTPNHGCVIEVGCYRGGTTIYVAMLQQLLGCRRRIY